ncbi:probable oxidoreductase [Cephalotrichum gorgonifer]|uniref:Probable oxidoreductase n=1 Tax=Cephalotrichum gorgonifer TaxID=2041049 RepID=A0AAE8MRH8_9PEZI|nr:probable oxidoreductase [Cephalotrichum gorgonifer]
MSAAKRLIVCGGNGFLGSRICKYAVARGWDVTSIRQAAPYRSGEPHWDAVTASAAPPPWAHKVTWERADILRPSTYAPLLKGADSVVHSMGILMEADYKGVVRGTESPLAGLHKAFSPSVNRGVDPLARAAGEDIAPPNPKDQFSYEVMNRDSAITLARHASDEGVATFCYISAIAAPPGLPARYISTKREAEKAIEDHFPQMRNVFVRPPFMYDNSRKFTLGIAAATGVGTLFNGLTKGAFGGLMGAGGIKPLKVDTVAEAVVEALADETVKGPVEVAQIDELATRAWRNSML